MSYHLRKMIRNRLSGGLKLKKTVKSIKEFRKIPFFRWCLFSFVLLGLVSLGSSSLPAESKMLAGAGLADMSAVFSIQSDDSLFLGAANRAGSDALEFLLIGNSSLMASSPTINVTPQILGMWLSEGDPANREEISEYIVEESDTISSIAERFGVSADTIIWANDLKNVSVRPGQKLLILPVSGVMHIVQSGDTVAKISKKYKADADRILAFNYLSQNEKLLEGEILVVPDGQIVAPVSSPLNSPKSVSNLSTNNFNGQSHAFPFGQCTWWVAQKKAIPAWGNAKDWLKNAMASGYQVCLGSSCVPKVGAAVSLAGNRIYGHVGYVEKVEDDKIVISEMNYIGWGMMNYRTIRIGSASIKGYIY